MVFQTILVDDVGPFFSVFGQPLPLKMVPDPISSLFYSRLLMALIQGVRVLSPSLRMHSACRNPVFGFLSAPWVCVSGPLQRRRPSFSYVAQKHLRLKSPLERSDLCVCSSSSRVWTTSPERVPLYNRHE